MQNLTERLVIVTLMAGSALVLGWRERRKDPMPLAVAIAAILFGLLTTQSLRFVEYFAPFSVAALAITSRPLAKRWLAPALFGVSLLFMLAFGMEPFKMIASKTEYIDARIARYFAQVIPEGSQVFTCGWDHTGNLMLALPERRFIVAADPTLFAKKDPDLYRIWRRIPLDAPIDSVEAIRLLFKSRYVICLNFEAYWHGRPGHRHRGGRGQPGDRLRRRCVGRSLEIGQRRHHLVGDLHPIRRPPTSAISRSSNPTPTSSESVPASPASATASAGAMASTSPPTAARPSSMSGSARPTTSARWSCIPPTPTSSGSHPRVTFGATPGSGAFTRPPTAARPGAS